MSEETFEGRGGIKLFARSWRTQTPAQAVVILQHGFKAHSGLYEWPAMQLNKRGFAAYAMDLRGHGRSEGERYYVDRFADYVEDLHAFITRIKAREPGLPLFLLGHSAGGVVACDYTLDHPQELTGLVCESFAHEVPAPDFALAVMKGLSHVAPHAHLFNLKAEDFSRDPRFVERMKTDPLIPHMAYPTNTVAELVRADERLRRDFQRIHLPVFILHGSVDKAAKPSGSQRFFDHAGSRDKTLKIYEGGYHDLLNDLDRERVMADVTEWLTTRLR